MNTKSIVAAFVVTLALTSPCITNTALAEAAKFEVNDSNVMKANLQKMIGQTVILRLQSGEEIGGKVSEVGTSAVHLSTLTGKEFYDAVVPLEKISALITRTQK